MNCESASRCDAMRYCGVRERERGGKSLMHAFTCLLLALLEWNHHHHCHMLPLARPPSLLTDFAEEEEETTRLFLSFFIDTLGPTGQCRVGNLRKSDRKYPIAFWRSSRPSEGRKSSLQQSAAAYVETVVTAADVSRQQQALQPLQVSRERKGRRRRLSSLLSIHLLHLFQYHSAIFT